MHWQQLLAGTRSDSSKARSKRGQIFRCHRHSPLWSRPASRSGTRQSQPLSTCWMGQSPRHWCHGCAFSGIASSANVLRTAHAVPASCFPAQICATLIEPTPSHTKGDSTARPSGLRHARGPARKGDGAPLGSLAAAPEWYRRWCTSVGAPTYSGHGSVLPGWQQRQQQQQQSSVRGELPS